MSDRSEQIQRLIDYILRLHLQAEITEGTAANLLTVDRISLRQMMINRYGEDWRSAADDPTLMVEKLKKAGDI